MKTIFLHRGRNKKSAIIGKLFTDIDYNFDYRGKNKLLLILKAIITATEIPKADIYFAEGGIILNAAVFTKILKARKSRIILMVPEPFFDDQQMSGITKKYVKWMMKYVHGVIAISDLVKKDAKKFYDGPIKIGHHPVLNMSEFLKVKAKLNSHNIVYVAERPKETGYTKGLDIAISAFKAVRKKVPDAKLYIIGAGTKELTDKKNNIVGLGFTNPANIYSKCSVLIAPARYDAFPLVVAEASLSGLIPIISTKVGSEMYIKKSDSSLVLSLKQELFTKKIIEVFETPLRKKQLLSKKLRAEAIKLTEENCKKMFLKAWKELL